MKRYNLNLADLNLAQITACREVLDPCCMSVAGVIDIVAETAQRLR